jgi:hypothetical protein
MNEVTNICIIFITIAVIFFIYAWIHGCVYTMRVHLSRGGSIAKTEYFTCWIFWPFTLIKIIIRIYGEHK